MYNPQLLGRKQHRVGFVEDAGGTYALTDLGSREALAAHNRRERAAHPEGEQEIYPRWQQSQYLHSMFSVRNTPLDNARYPELRWTSALAVLAGNWLVSRSPLLAPSKGQPHSPEQQ